MMGMDFCANFLFLNRVLSLTREAFCVIRTDTIYRVQRQNPMQQFPDARCVRGDELGSLGLDLDPDFNTLQEPFLAIFAMELWERNANKTCT